MNRWKLSHLNKSYLENLDGESNRGWRWSNRRFRRKLMCEIRGRRATRYREWQDTEQTRKSGATNRV